MSRDLKELDFEVHHDLCRILDNGEDWRLLAGLHMKYSAFEINEIENMSRRTGTSATRLLLERWSNHVHSVKELFVLLYHMRHVPAMRCLARCVDADCLRLLSKLQPGGRTARLDENANQKIQGESVTTQAIPIHVQTIGEQEPRDQGIKRQQTANARTEISSSENMSETTSEGTAIKNEVMKGAAWIPCIPYQELSDATDNWAKSNVLGRGGFGEVYRGEWKQTLVAIKRLKSADTANQDSRAKAVNQEFIRELCLNGYRHDNLLPLYGYSLERGPCLVYQLMQGGSLQNRLRPRPPHPSQAPLTWPQRHRIALGTARGLQFLHSRANTALIHGDIKPANILLDTCLEPKIGDFGLARNGPFGENRTHVMVSKVQGTRYYLPEDFCTSHYLSPAVDVFSFGLVLLELASALRVYDAARGKSAWLRDYVHHVHKTGGSFEDLEDPLLINTDKSEPVACRRFVMLGVECTHAFALHRPSMIKVYETLKQMVG